MAGGQLKMWDVCPANCCGGSGCQWMWSRQLRLTVPAAVGDYLDGECSCDCDLAGQYDLEYCDSDETYAANPACYRHLLPRWAAGERCLWGLILEERTCPTEYWWGWVSPDPPYAWMIDWQQSTVRFEWYAYLKPTVPAARTLVPWVILYQTIQSRQTYPGYDPAEDGALLPEWYEFIYYWSWRGDPLPDSRRATAPIELRAAPGVFSSVDYNGFQCERSWTRFLCNADSYPPAITLDAYGVDA